MLTREGYRGIEEVEVGDEVLSFIGEANQWGWRPVTRAMSHEYEGEFVTVVVGGEELTATVNHPFCVTSRSEDRRSIPLDIGADPLGCGDGCRWVEAGSLALTDQLELPRGIEAVAELKRELGSALVYNLEVARTHNYLVGSSGVLVHNKSASAILQTGGRTIKQSTAEALGLTKGQAKTAIEALKKFALFGRIGAAGAVTSWRLPRLTEPYGSEPALLQSRVDAVRVGERIFVAWESESTAGDARNEQVWLQELAWSEEAPEVIDIVNEWRLPVAGEGGPEQRRPALGGSPLFPEGALIAAWEDHSGSDEERPVPDLMLQVRPVPFVVLGDAGAGPESG